jgi:hypothetical protein
MMRDALPASVGVEVDFCCGCAPVTEQHLHVADCRAVGEVLPRGEPARIVPLREFYRNAGERESE